MFAVSFSVLLGSQNAYAGNAGNGCIVDPNMLNFGVIDSDVLVGALKTITCSADVTDVVIDTSDCDANGISVFFLSPGIITSGVWTRDELIGIGSFGGTLQRSCDVKFTVTHLLGEDILFQSISLIRGDFIGGEIIPIETTSLLLVSAQTFSWMIPVVLSVLGIGLFVVSRKSE